MSGTPASLVNRALDQLGRPELALGELEEGTEGAKPALRAYGPAVRQLHRVAHWDFARKQAPLLMLGDATGQTPNVGKKVLAPFCYEYALPIDCMKMRFVPWNSNPQQPNPPIMTGLGQQPLNAVRLRPAPFLLSLDYNYPVETGNAIVAQGIPDWANCTGTGPQQRTVILTNVPPQPQTNAPVVMPCAVYTCLVVYPSQWDSLFEQALVNYLVQLLAMALVKGTIAEKRAVRDDAIKIAKGMIEEARATNANESGYPQTTSHTPDWISARNQGGGNYGGWGGSYDGYSGPGILWGGYDSVAWSDGSVY
jgi:hypothetical protein